MQSISEHFPHIFKLVKQTPFHKLNFVKLLLPRIEEQSSFVKQNQILVIEVVYLPRSIVLIRDCKITFSILIITNRLATEGSFVKFIMKFLDTFGAEFFVN